MVSIAWKWSGDMVKLTFGEIYTAANKPPASPFGARALGDTAHQLSKNILLTATLTNMC